MSFHGQWRVGRIRTPLRRMLVAMLVLFCAGAVSRPAVAQFRASLSGTTLTITGDANSNILEIGGTQPGEVIINGVETYVGVATLKIDLKEEYDQVLFLNVDLSGNLEVKVGNGGSVVQFLACSYGGNVSISAGDGIDSIQLVGETFTHVGNDLKVETGRGDSRFELHGLTVGHNLTVKTGDDFDRISSSNITVGNDCVVDSGNADDDLQFFTSVHVGNNFTVRSGGGFDNVVVHAIESQGNVTIETGDDPDRVTVSDSIFVGDDLVVRTGAGADTVVVGGALEVDRDVDVNTGTGDDELFVYNTVSTEFEVGRDLWLDTGSDHDHVFINNARSLFGYDPPYGTICVERDLVIKTSNGMDVVNVRGIDVRENLNIDTGTQNDDLALRSLVVRGSATVLLAGQDDSLRIEDAAIVFGSFTLNGGGDYDGYSFNNVLFFAPPKITNFEYVFSSMD